MDKLLHSKFDSDEEDEDYIPEEDKNIKKQQDSQSDSELTGVAGLKAQKRKREIDDLWAQMNADEDDYYKKKVQKTEEK